MSNKEHINKKEKQPIEPLITPATPEQKAFYTAGFDLAVNYLYRIINEDQFNTLDAKIFKAFVIENISDKIIDDNYFATNPIKPNDTADSYPSGQCPGPGGVGCVDCPYLLRHIQR